MLWVIALDWQKMINLPGLARLTTKSTCSHKCKHIFKDFMWYAIRFDVDYAMRFLDAGQQATLFERHLEVLFVLLRIIRNPWLEILSSEWSFVESSISKSKCCGNASKALFIYFYEKRRAVDALIPRLTFIFDKCATYLTSVVRPRPGCKLNNSAWLRLIDLETFWKSINWLVRHKSM